GAWIRVLLRSLADEGRTVFVSSHLMSEMENTADHLIVIGRGKLIADTNLEEFTRRASGGWVEVASPETRRLAQLLSKQGATGKASPGGGLTVRGISAAGIGDLAARHDIVQHQLVTRQPSLEEAFMELTK